MATIFTAAQMARFEAAHVAAGLNSWTGLMEAAAAAVVDALAAHFGARFPKRTHVMCGPGNNGGDGYGIAALLHDQGHSVRLWQYGDRLPASPAATEMRTRWGVRGPVRPFASLPDDMIKAGDLVVDAIFGIGLHRPIDAGLHRTLMALPPTCHRVAVDIPTGINAETGAYLGPSPGHHPRPVDLTVTFACMKPGHVLGVGALLSGRVQVASIGLEDSLAAARMAGEEPLVRIEGGDLPWHRHLVKSPLFHKYHHGHVLVLAGGSTATGGGKGGAARLAARAALRVGAGLVTLGVHRDTMAEHAAHLNAIMLTETSTRQQLDACLSDERINTIVVGPGFGKGSVTRVVVQRLLALGRNLVLDADALTAFAGQPRDLLDRLHPNVVLTPHMGEFRQLFPARTEAPVPRLQAVRRAADLCRATVVLKGHDTLVASAGRRIRVACPDDRAACAWLATAGSGDVLAGLIGGLMARGADAHMAACMAVQLHQDAASTFGPGLTADDLDGALTTAVARRCRSCVSGAGDCGPSGPGGW